MASSLAPIQFPTVEFTKSYECIEAPVRWIRNAEESNTILRVMTYTLAMIGLLALCATVIGIPLALKFVQVFERQTNESITEAARKKFEATANQNQTRAEEEGKKLGAGEFASDNLKLDIKTAAAALAELKIDPATCTKLGATDIDAELALKQILAVNPNYMKDKGKLVVGGVSGDYMLKDAHDAALKPYTDLNIYNAHRVAIAAGLDTKVFFTPGDASIGQDPNTSFYTTSQLLPAIAQKGKPLVLVSQDDLDTLKTAQTDLSNARNLKLQGSLSNQIAQLQQELATAKDPAQNGTKALQAQIDDLNQKLLDANDPTKNGVKALQAQIDKLNQQLTAANDPAENGTKALQAQIDKLNQQLTAANDPAKNGTQKLQAQIDDLNQKLAFANDPEKNGTNALKAKIKTLENDLKKANAGDQTGLQETITTLRENETNLNKQYQELQDQLQIQVDSASAQKELANAKAKEVEALTRTAQQKAQGYDTIITDLQEKLKQAEKKAVPLTPVKFNREFARQVIDDANKTNGNREQKSAAVLRAIETNLEKIVSPTKLGSDKTEQQ